MPRSLRPLWAALGLRWPSRPLLAVLLVVLLAMLSVAQLANAAMPDADLQRHCIPESFLFVPIGK